MAGKTQTQVKSGADAQGVVKITGMHHSGLLCNDLDRAVDFYTRVLGMEVISEVRGKGGRPGGHFTGTRVPADVEVDTKDGQADLDEFVALHQRLRGGKTPEGDSFVRLRAGSHELVLFERPEPIPQAADEKETLVENGIFHQSFFISTEDLDRLSELKRQGGSGIRFHTGPVLRWPHGRAIYLWDTEGNYLELEAEEDLPAQFGVKGH